MDRETKPCPFYGMPCEYVPMGEKLEAALGEIFRLRATLQRVGRTYAADGSRLIHSEQQIIDIVRNALEDKP